MDISNDIYVGLFLAVYTSSVLRLYAYIQAGWNPLLKAFLYFFFLWPFIFISLSVIVNYFIDIHLLETARLSMKICILGAFLYVMFDYKFFISCYKGNEK